MRLPFVAEAADDLQKAAAWYESRRSGYGSLLVAEVMQVAERAAQLPLSGAPVRDMDPARDVRRFLVRRFPYSVITAIVNDERAIVAVAHGRRDPGYWHERLR